MTGQLLGFSRENEPKKEICSITDILEEAADMALRGTNVGRVISVRRDICAIEADRYQILQVLINLLINARQAMPGGGTIHISAEEKREGADEQENPLQVPAVEIVIVDEGAGIAEEVLSHIFDPFYTTKSRGTGLGLVIAQSIVEKHDGYIHIDSKQNVGTTARILLPAFQGKVPPVQKKSRSITKHKGRILIMDDDNMVRTAMADMLELMGLEVEHARNGNEAIELYLKSRAQKNPFNGVILDLTIGMKHGGKETMKRLREIDPDVKALITSGYHYDEAVLDFQKHGFKGALPKPVKIAELNKAVGALLSKDPAVS